ncbi:Uncharacterised protein [Vibrio cholerae]|nr:Uncharacterised protein [Vibrio cholerae]CSI78365.1 Uncharacterised protein [Vibrio cholerae]
MVSRTASVVSWLNRSEACAVSELKNISTSISNVIMLEAISRPFFGTPLRSVSPNTFGKLPSLAARLPASPTSIIQEPSDVKHASAVKADTNGAVQLPNSAVVASAKGAPDAATSEAGNIPLII